MDRARTVVIGVADEALGQALYRHLGTVPSVALVTARSLEDVLLPVLDGRCEIAVLDLDLPGASSRSIQVLKTAAPDLRLIVIAPDADLEKGREVLRHNVFYFAAKPVSEAELLASVEQALAHGAERKVPHD